MNTELTSERAMLKDSVDKFLANHYDFDRRRALVASPLGYDRENWRAFADLGWLAVPFSAENGGFGGTALDVVTITEAFGKALVTEPFVASLILGGRLVERLGAPSVREALLAKLVAGELQLALAHSERHAGDDPAYVATRVERDGDDFLISGDKVVVLNGESADKLVVTARSAGGDRDRAGIEVFVVDADGPGIRRRSYRTFDGMRAAHVRFESARAPGSARLGDPRSNFEAIEEILDEALIAYAAEAIGAMEVILRDTVEYAKTRKQFGQPIGKFQVLQFRMVDMWLAYQQSLSALQMAAIDHARGGALARRSASALKVVVSRASRFVGEAAIQIHGGIGTSDDLRVGHYFKRLLCIDVLLGGMDYHLDRYAASMMGSGEPTVR